MRSMPLKAVSTLLLASAWACGSGSNVGPNLPPVATFTAPTCTVGVPCSFTSTSTDPDGSIASSAWEFGDGQTAQGATATNTFATAGTFQVKLTVTDNAGATGTVTNPVTVGASNNLSPTAGFDLPATCTAGTPCGFHSTSTDADGTIASTHWDFGDTGAGDGPDATHTFAAAGAYSVTLTVTDNGGATGTATKQLTVSPAASQDCTTTGRVVDCSLGMTQKVTVKVVLTSRSCQLAGNQLSSTGPVAQTVFFNLCNRTIGEEYTIKDGAGGTLVFQAGSSLGLRFQQGTAGPGDPPTGDPGIRIQGSYPTWTLDIDDGGAAGTQGEPDFNDVILTVQATLAP